MGSSGVTVRVSHIPAAATADDLINFFEAAAGPVFASKIDTARKDWKPRGFGLVQFESPESAESACRLSAEGKLGVLRGGHIAVSPSNKDILARAADPLNRIQGAVLRVGFLSEERRMEVLGSWDGVRAEIMPERKKLEIFLGDAGERYKLEVMFGDVVSTSKCRLSGGESSALLLELKYAPRIYQRVRGPTMNSKFVGFRCDDSKENMQFHWVRATDFSSSNSIGKSSFFCLEPAEGVSALQKVRNFQSSEHGDLTLVRGQICSSSKLVPVISCPCDYSVAYEVLFQLNSLVHMRKVSCVQVNDDLFDTLSKLSLDTSVRILNRMHQLKSTCYNPVQFINNQLDNIRRNQKNMSAKKNIDADSLMSIHRVYVTPSKLYFLGPELEKTNHVVKHYSTFASNFLRVSFVEEDWNKLPSEAISSGIYQRGLFTKPFRTGIYSRILSILREGVLIGSKKFEFLAFSASQLRFNSVWMFASAGNVTADSIREWMGHFRRIHSVSKCAARMGQQFSSSQQTLHVVPHSVKVIPDVEVITDGIKYCFSDGIGKISISFARQIAQKCRLDHTPSAFQIRYGGYKGVVVVDRRSFHKLSLRPSMLKFDSKNTMLNVTSWSQYLPCFLNREIVCLLSTLGIEDGIFESLQHDQTRLLDEMLRDKDVALMVLGRMTAFEVRTAMKMLLRGYEPNSEPYLAMMLKSYREYQLSDVRSKCRIFVPKGRVLIGCLDETGTLNYGQVYVRVTVQKEELQYRDCTFFNNVDQTTAVVVGEVVVTKNPCLHPGDIRVLQAVYDPQFVGMDLVDCIVFPQNGKRPHPNECSGGDLDGDLYFVCWDEKLVPRKTDTPMDYIARRPRLMDHEVTLEEIQKFFLDYMINDTLGVISTTHLVHADSKPMKARSPECLHLARLHSMAVDFAKTGAPAEMPKILKNKMFPDFMERPDRPMYVSTGVLGKLYRAASIQTDEGLKLVPKPTYDSDLEVEGFEAFLEAAEEYYDQYDDRLRSLMSYYEVEHEDEILTGNLRNRSVYLQRDRKRYAEVKDRVLIGVRSLHEEVEGWFKCSCSGSESSRMASAWYHVTYHPKYWSEERFLSFPWILNDVLLMIKASKTHRR